MEPTIVLRQSGMLYTHPVMLFDQSASRARCSYWVRLEAGQDQRERVFNGKGAAKRGTRYRALARSVNQIVVVSGDPPKSTIWLTPRASARYRTRPARGCERDAN